MKNLTKSYWFVLSIPVINAIAANTANYSGSDVYNTGTLRAAILSVFFIYFVFTLYPRNFPSRVILSSIFYLLFLVPFSTNIPFSLFGVLKFSLGVFMFPVGYYFINTPEKYRTLMKSLLVALVIYLIFIVISNALSLGKYDYAVGTFYFGSGSVNITKDIFVLVLMAPVCFILFPSSRNWLILLFTIGFLVAVVGIKRSVLISTILSVLIYLYKTGFRSNQVRFVLGGTFLIVMILVIFPSVYALFVKRINAREDQLTLEEKKIEKEQRYGETTLVLKNWADGSLAFKLFGSEPFNDRQYYKAIRMLHTDYMVMLNGTGAVGIFFWFFIYAAIFMEKAKYRKIIRSYRLLIEIDAIFLALLFSQLFMSVSSTVYAISLRGFIFLFWGASLSLMKSFYTEYRKSLIKQYVEN